MELNAKYIQLPVRSCDLTEEEQRAVDRFIRLWRSKDPAIYENIRSTLDLYEDAEQA